MAGGIFDIREFVSLCSIFTAVCLIIEGDPDSIVVLVGESESKIWESKSEFAENFRVIFKRLGPHHPPAFGSFVPNVFQYLD